MSWVASRNWKPCIFVIDFLVAVSEINCDSYINSRHNSIIMNCRQLLLTLSGSRLIHGGRSTNRVADAMAKSSRKKLLLCNQVCNFQSPHPDCNTFLLQDSLNIVANALNLSLLVIAPGITLM